MKTWHLVLVLILGAFVACNSHTPHQYGQQLLGRWKFAKYGKLGSDRMGNSLLKTEIALKGNTSFNFGADSVYISRPGYTGKVAYRLSGDSLGVYDQKILKFTWANIAYMDADTMLLKYGDTTYVKAARVK